MPKSVNIPLQFVVHPLPGSAEQLGEKLKEVGERLRRGNFGLPAAPAISASNSGVTFRLGSQTGGAFGSVLVTQIEVGPSHFAFLLDDGRVCRLPFSVISDRLDLSRTSNSLMGMAQSGGSGSGLGKSVSKVAHTSAASGEHPITPYFILGLYCKTFYVGH
jgi:E3 ubiquitin-protein ligase EDD1